MTTKSQHTKSLSRLSLQNVPGQAPGWLTGVTTATALRYREDMRGEQERKVNKLQFKCVNSELLLTFYIFIPTPTYQH